jgi:hypothetical protein
MKRTHEKERVGALSAGLAVVVLLWVAAEAFASPWIQSLGLLSIWLYGPITAAVWGFLSFIAFLLIMRAQRRNPALCPEHEEATREARGAVTSDLAKIPKCIEQVDALEKDKLAALMAGFAITIAVWLAVLSFAPFQWLESILSRSPWIYCLMSIALWCASAELMYWGFRSRRRLHPPSVPVRQ